MANTIYIGGSIKPGGPDVVYPASMNVNWFTVNTDSSQANTAAQLANPSSVSTTYVVPASVGQGTRLRLVARMDAATSTVTTSPVVRVFGSDKEPNSSGAFPTGTIFHRIDSDNWNDAGTTLSLSVTANASQKDSSWNYSSALPVSSGWDMLGAKAIVVLVETAASVSGGVSTAVPVLAGVIN